MAGIRCSKVPVGGSFSGSRLDSPVSISDSPLVGLRPFLLPMFHPQLPFFCWHCGTGWRFYCIRQRFTLSLRHHTTGIVPSDEICFCNSLLPVPIIVTFVPNKHHWDNASGPVVSHAGLRGAITSPCSNDSESRRPTPTISGLSLYMLFQWSAVGLANAFYGTLWETAI